MLKQCGGNVLSLSASLKQFVGDLYLIVNEDDLKSGHFGGPRQWPHLFQFLQNTGKWPRILREEVLNRINSIFSGIDLTNFQVPPETLSLAVHKLEELQEVRLVEGPPHSSGKEAKKAPLLPRAPPPLQRNITVTIQNDKQVLNSSNIIALRRLLPQIIPLENELSADAEGAHRELKAPTPLLHRASTTSIPIPDESGEEHGVVFHIP